MKKILALLTSFVLILALAGCSNDSTNTDSKDDSKVIDIETITKADLEGTTITYWHAQTAENGKALDLVVDKFNKENEYGITVVANSQGGYTDTKTKIQSALVSNEYPNVAQGYGNDIAEHMESGKVVNLDKYFSSPKWGYTEEEKADFIPSYLEEMHAFEDGSTYQTMMAKSTEAFFYDKDFFEEHGLTVPTTTDELTEVAKKASEILGKAAFGVDSPANFFITYSQAFGAEYTDNKGNVYFGNDENKEATLKFLTWWEEGVKGEYFRLPGEDRYTSTTFNSGDVVMFIGSTSGVNYISDEINWSVAEIPAGPTGQKVMQQGGNVFMLDSGDAKENLASWIFMSYMMEPDNSNLYALNTGYVPIRKSSYETEEYKNYIETSGAKGLVKETVGGYADSSLIYDPIFKESYSVRTEVGKIIESIVFGTDAETALTEGYANLSK